ncbi:uncharacterized protein PAC_11175 [Phialocephala subalpina]|uniref:Uncharacterized protein n=1 Tax=Phialocephala subalpina TaxID=576137 RepID=A0A1L7X8C2_9HELO|nr:uncharacterized protein PAC_11175 [Phialocephala subalpina]
MMQECGPAGDAMASVKQEPPFDDRQLVKWIENQSLEEQERIATQCLKHLLEKAAQPRHASGNACIKLCYFLEQCRRSNSSSLRDFAFCKDPCLELFNFYIEWNEKNQNRSMRQVLELVSSLVARNPDEATALTLKTTIAQRTVAIITHQAAQPLVKPAFKCLEYLVGKGTIPADNLIDIYESRKGLRNRDIELKSPETREKSWDMFVSETFEWMVFPDVSPAAGKFLVTIFRALKDQKASYEGTKDFYSASWQRWISNGLDKNPDALENVKNHLFPPLFKLDRAGSIVFLKDLNSKSQSLEVATEDAGAHALLRLSAMEMGKKSGLVVEPATLEYLNTAKKASTAVTLAEGTLMPLVLHASDTVRSLAFSVLVSSLSSTRPFSRVAIDIFKSCMDVLYSNPDPKFRNEVLSNTKHMIERLRGATSLMSREVENLSYRPREDEKLDESLNQKQVNLQEEVVTLLQDHQDFIAWYLQFLLGEFIPTASYQRHIMALKATILLLHSGIDNSMSQPVRNLGNATSWPFTIHFFTPGVIRLLMDLLLDPFEDVRSTAADILRLASPASFEVNITNQCLMPANDVLEAEEPARSTATMIDKIEGADRVDIGHPSGKDFVSEKNHPESDNKRSLGVLTDFIENAKAVSTQTGRADYADGLACSFELLYRLQPSADARTNIVSQLIDDLEKKIQIAENNLGQAVLGAPIHGNFAALRLIWDSSAFVCDNSDQQTASNWTRSSLDSLQSRITIACIRTWGAVKKILCNDSPEGHLLEDLEDVDVVDTKNILSYSFRAIHESRQSLCLTGYALEFANPSSNLLRSLVAKRKLSGPDGSALLPLDLFQYIGDLTFDQLSNLRHRGAFSTVSLTFATCCALTQYKARETSMASQTSGATKLQEWYEKALQCVQEQASTTRRSAGIPAMLTSIMGARSEEVPFANTMNDLMNIAWEDIAVTESEATNIPQVHALNSLREAFKSSSIGALCEPYIGDSLRLTVHCLRSEVWAIRNCGLLLFRSLTDLLLGTSVGKAEIDNGWDGKSTKIQYERYPELGTTLEELLAFPQDPNEKYQPEIVLPALDIIRRAGPPDGDSERMFQLVVEHLNCPIWDVRQMAARALCALTMGDDFRDRIIRVLANTEERVNFRHGCLVAARCIIDREASLNPIEVADAFEDIAAIWEDQWISECSNQARSFILAELLRVRSAMLSAALAASKIPATFDNFSVEDIKAYAKQALDTTECPELYQAFIEQLLLLAALNKMPYTLAFAATQLDPDSALQMLDHVSKHFGSDIELTKITDMYAFIYEHQNDSDVRAATLSHFSNTLERKYNQNTPKDEELSKSVLRIRAFPSQLEDSPTLRNARINFSGWIMLFKLLKISRTDTRTKDTTSEEFREWAEMLKDSGEARKDFDTRLAGAKAMEFVFTNIKVENTRNPELLPIHLILYDTLNDDDSEIREIGARIVSLMARQSLVALAATRWLTQELLLPIYGTSPLFVWNVVCRMAGTKTNIYRIPNFRLLSVNTQLTSAFVRDADLFAIEKDNLYVDEVRELDLWTRIFNKLPRQNDNDNEVSPWLRDSINALLDWATEGLAHVNAYNAHEMKFCWDSNPSTFAVYARIISCSQAVIEHMGYIKVGRIAALKPAYSIWSEKYLKIVDLLHQWESLALKQRTHGSLLRRLYDRDPEDSFFRSRLLVQLIAPIEPSPDRY